MIYSRALKGRALLCGITLLLGLIGAVLFLIVSVAFDEPPSSLSIENSECWNIDPDGKKARDRKRFYLPFDERTSLAEQARAVRCSFDLDLIENATSGIGLLIPSLSGSVTVAANGQLLGTFEFHIMRNLFNATLPVFIPRIDTVLLPGNNQFQITVSAPPGRTLALDRIFIGDTLKLHQHYSSKWLLYAIIPTVVVGSEIALALVFVLIWFARPRQSELGWLALMLALGAIRGTAIIPDFGLSSAERSFWNGLVVWEAFAAFMFCSALTHTSVGKWSIMLAVPALLFTATYTFGPISKLAPTLILMGMCLVVLYISCAVWTLVRATFSGNRDATVVLPGMIVLFAFISYDIFAILSPETSRIFLTRTVYGCFVITTAALMTFRFVRAMNQLDNVAATLSQRVVQVEEDLRVNYEELRIRREVEVIERERSRLMRDLHDGIGGDLSSILALADFDRPSQKEIAQHARTALTDMRLIISSLEDYGGDLSLALGSWRERAGPQFRATGLTLIWQVLDVPALNGMGPAHVLDILRIVQESVTNIMKHANALHVWIKTEPIGESICLSIADDGPDFISTQSGNGMANMHARAARLGAMLTIERSESRTCVMLILPRDLSAGLDRMIAM